MNKIKKGTRKIFLSSFPGGELRQVELLGKSPYLEDGIYIRYLDGKGGTDTTTEKFLFDIPKSLKQTNDRSSKT